jgi:hypothetical protein
MIAGAAALAGLVAFHSAGGTPKHAEYAARWDPAAGGPATAAEAATRLGLEAPGASTACEVRYFDLPAPKGTPKGAAVILRRRVCDDGSAEIRLKYRTAHPVADWACPALLEFHASSQVDVGFGADAPSRVYAYACTLSAREPPVPLHAVPKPCAARMTRYETFDAEHHRVKIEDWTLPGGGRRLEVSRTARDEVDSLAAFEQLVVRLRASGARLLEESKTELGSRCPENGAR